MFICLLISNNQHCMPSVVSMALCFGGLAKICQPLALTMYKGSTTEILRSDIADITEI